MYFTKIMQNTMSTNAGIYTIITSALDSAYSIEIIKKIIKRKSNITFPMYPISININYILTVPYQAMDVKIIIKIFTYTNNFCFLPNDKNTVIKSTMN